MTTDFPTAPSAYGLYGPSAAVTVEKSTHASHTEILTPPIEKQNSLLAGRANKAENELIDARNKISELERQYSTYKDAVEKSFMNLVKTISSASPQESWIKFQTEISNFQLSELSIPEEPTNDEISWYSERSRSNNRVEQLPQFNLERMKKIHQSLVYWSEKNNEKYKDIYLCTSELLQK